MNESANPILKYFSEFKILKTVSKDFWLTNVVQFFDGMAYFSMITVFVLYLTDYCSFNDADAALWVGLYTLFISAFVFAVGSICDIIGIRRTYLIGFIILIAGRLIMGFGPDLSPTVDSGRLAVMAGILIMSFGTAFMSPVIQTSIRRFTPLKARSTGFNIYYLLMNISAVIANVFLIEFFRKHFGAVDGWDNRFVDTFYASGEPFPDDLDQDGDGLIYFLYSGEEIPTFGDEDKAQRVDGREYEAWRWLYLHGATEITLPTKYITPDNITPLGCPMP